MKYTEEQVNMLNKWVYENIADYVEVETIELAIHGCVSELTLPDIHTYVANEVAFSVDNIPFDEHNQTLVVIATILDEDADGIIVDLVCKATKAVQDFINTLDFERGHPCL